MKTLASKPLVSCVCITRKRRRFFAAALEAFALQKWPALELVVLEDGEDLVRDLCKGSGVRYNFLHGTHRIAEKRNLACMIARGDILAHWDDDDWSAPARIRNQVERLVASGKAVTGYRTMLFSDGARAFRYQGSENYAVGSSLCYRKDFWKAHPFVDQRGPEDNHFVSDARRINQLEAADAGELMVARIHPGNTLPKKPLENPNNWKPLELSELPKSFLEAERKLAC